MSQSIILPDKCLGCGADRQGIQEGLAVYRCGSSIRIVQGRAKVTRSLKCLANSTKQERTTPIGGY